MSSNHEHNIFLLLFKSLKISLSMFCSFQDTGLAHCLSDLSQILHNFGTIVIISFLISISDRLLPIYRNMLTFV